MQTGVGNASLKNLIAAYVAMQKRLGSRVLYPAAKRVPMDALQVGQSYRGLLPVIPLPTHAKDFLAQPATSPWTSPQPNKRIFDVMTKCFLSCVRRREVMSSISDPAHPDGRRQPPGGQISRARLLHIWAD